MAVYNKFNCFVEDLLKGVHDFDNDTFNVALSNSAPDSANDVTLSDITEIADGGGYAAGGYSLDNIVLSRSGGTAKVVCDDETITATGAALATFRYVIVYNATAASDPLIAWYDYGTGLTLEENESLTIDFNQSTGVFTLT